MSWSDSITSAFIVPHFERASSNSPFQYTIIHCNREFDVVLQNMLSSRPGYSLFICVNLPWVVVWAPLEIVARYYKKPSDRQLRTRSVA